MRQATLGAAVAAAALLATGVEAAPIELVPNSVFMFRDTRGINDVGVQQGDRFQFGANVTGGSLGTSLGATYSPTGFTVSQFACAPLSVNQNFCSRTTAFNANRLDPWTLRFSRPNEASLETTGPSLLLPNQNITQQVPFPVSVTISGAGTTPTISWQVPGGFLPDGFRIQIFDKSKTLADGSKDIIAAAGIPGSSTSFTIPAGWLQEGGNYSINFQLVETRGHVAFSNANTQIYRRSSSFFAFTPLNGNGPPNVSLPQVEADANLNDNLGPVYHFSQTNVGPSSVTFIDPFVAAGYDYAKGNGDPNFASVILPHIGDDEFLISFLLGTTEIDETVLAGEQFFFPQGGVDAFKVRGIETSAGLDPDDVTAFITGLTFVSPGDFTGTMTPVLEFVPDQVVPEPSAILRLATGIGMLPLIRRRRCEL